MSCAQNFLFCFSQKSVTSDCCKSDMTWKWHLSYFISLWSRLTNPVSDLLVWFTAPPLVLRSSYLSCRIPTSKKSGQPLSTHIFIRISIWWMFIREVIIVGRMSLGHMGDTPTSSIILQCNRTVIRVPIWYVLALSWRRRTLSVNFVLDQLQCYVMGEIIL
jgi:hypothetical protein